MTKDHGSSIKDDERYERLREEGASREKAARIANTGRSQAGKRGGKASRYEDQTKRELQQRAGELGNGGAFLDEQGRAYRSAQESLRVAAAALTQRRRSLTLA